MCSYTENEIDFSSPPSQLKKQERQQPHFYAEKSPFQIWLCFRR